MTATAVTEESAPDASELRLLLIEDNPGDARLIRAHLEEGLEEPFALEQVERLEAALRRLRENRPDLVLLDLGLPDASGLDAVRALRSVDGTEPIVVLTGLDDEVTALRALREGAQDYLLKDALDPHTLRRSVRYSLERQRAATQRDRARRAAERAGERWATIFETVPTGIVISDAATGRMHASNVAFAEIFGYTEDELVGHTSLELGMWEDPDRRDDVVARAREKGKVEGEEAWFRTADGSRGRMRLSCRWLELEGEGRLLWAVEDITEQRKRERKLEETTDHLHGLLDASAALIFRIRLEDLAITYAAPNAEDVTGFPQERWTDEPGFWMDRIPDEDLEPALERLTRAASEGEDQVDIEFRVEHADGDLHHYRAVARFERDDEGNPVSVVGTALDVTEQKRLEERLLHQSMHDPLTGLPNRVLFVDRADRALGASRRRSEPLALLIFDVDRFKRINDSLGPAVGDRVLEEIGHRLSRTVRQEDTVSRIGGDEFGVLLGGLEGMRDLETARGRLLRALERPLEFDGEELRLDLTVGAAIYSPAESDWTVDVEDPEDLVRYADQALHHAKSLGGESFHVFDPRSDAVGDRMTELELEQDLRRALEAGEFKAFFQPILRLDTGEVWGVEPLARWRHPERGLVSPGEFIPLAEETGLIHDLGRVVLLEACQWAAAWSEERENGVRLRVTPNVSGRQFEREDLLKHLEESLERSGLEPASLCLEVTETSIMRATHRIDELRRLGLRVLVDDFGTGYSSLLYLRDLDVDGLKIDMSFVQGLGQDVGNTAIVDTILTLGRRMGLQVVAEGIETEAQLSRLQALGCELGQGYHFARPMPADEMGRYLADGKPSAKA